MEGSPRFDGPTLERVMKGDVVYREAHEVTHRERVKGSRSVLRSPFAWYCNRGLLSESQKFAGAKAIRLFIECGQPSRIIARYGERQSTESLDRVDRLTDDEAEARTLLTAALAAVGPTLAPVLVHVLLLSESAKSWAEQRGQRGASASLFGMRRLRWALDKLAKHFGVRSEKRH